MDAKIEGEDESYIKIYITDNSGVMHDLTVEKDTGEIAYHGQDGYPDNSSNRTTAGDEHVNQARRYARFHVYRNRGYETVEPLRNPDRIAAVALAVGSLTTEQLRDHFGEYYQQLLSYQTGDDPLVEVPVDPEDGLVRPEVDVYLPDASSDWEAAAETLADSSAFEQLEHAPGPDAGADRIGFAFQSVLGNDHVDLADEAAAIGDFLIEDVSPLRVWWQRGVTSDTVETPGSTPDRDPDARLQMLVNSCDFQTLEGFQQSLVHHLRCQVRDCYIRMGLTPPDDLRVQGMGIYEQIGWYENHDFYPDYHDHRITIADW